MASIGTLKNAVTLVTGGASGLGKATAERFVRLGSKVVICDLPTSKGKEVAEGLGNNCVFAPTDVTSVKDVANALDLCKSKFQKLDNVVNCAGIAIAVRTLHFPTKKPHDLELFNKILLTNVGGSFNVASQAAVLMNENEGNKDGQRGVIINTSSVAAFDGQVGTFVHTYSNNTTTKCLFITPLMESLPEKVKTHLASTVPFPKRFGDPDEYAHMCQSIIENPFINGEVIRLDGAIRMMP
nr:17 beta-hydroxysteroid dehydrogenase 10 [Sinonovacula constricta]